MMTPDQQQSNNANNARVTMSALASQLASPPALMSNSTINPSTFNFAQLKPQTQQITNQPQQQNLLNNINSNSDNSNNSNSGITSNRLIGQQTIISRDSLAIPSPGSGKTYFHFLIFGSFIPVNQLLMNDCFL